METPTVSAYTVPDWEPWIVVFDCPYCSRQHQHGTGMAEPPAFGQSLGHRVAHCRAAASPYRESGYELVYAGELVLAPRKRRAA